MFLHTYTVFSYVLFLSYSAGSANALRDKARYPTLVCILPSKIEEYAETFLALLRWYNWRTITFICDLNTSPDVTDCLEFPEILRRQKSTYNVNDFTADLSQEKTRISALTQARKQSKSKYLRFFSTVRIHDALSYSLVIVILAHMDIVRATLVHLIEILFFVTSEEN